MTAIPTRSLGSNGPTITVIGCGTWAIGGADWKYSWGGQDDWTSVRTLRHAIGLGVNWIDTAAIYGRGHAEEMVGKAISAIPESERPLIFTKCGLRPSNAVPLGDPTNMLRPDSVRMECEASLRRLNVDHIDMLQFHWPDTSGVEAEDSWGTMAELIEEGKVCYGGVSNYDIALLERCEKIRHVDSLQPPFSLIDRRAGHELLSWCADNGTGVITYSPLQCGLLTDSFSSERVALMDPRDFRLWHQDFTHYLPPALEKNLAFRDRLFPIVKRHGTTVACIALAWALSWRGVTGVIVGSRSPDQVDGWIAAGDVKLTGEDFDEIERALTELGIGMGPTRPSTTN